MWGSIFSSILGGLGGLFGNKKAQQREEDGFTTSGWANERDGVVRLGSRTETESPRGPVRRAWAAGNNFLGSQIGTVAKNIAGGMFDDSRQRRNTRKHYDFLRSKGLTAQEIAGSGGGGAIRSQGSTLGSGPAQQAQDQQSFIADQAQRERDNKLKVAQITSGPAAERAYLEGRLNPAKLKQIQLTNKKLKIELKRQKLELKNYFPILFSKMGADNMTIAMAAYIEGVDAETILKGTGLPANRETRAQMARVAAFASKYKGVSGNIQGLGRTLADEMNNVLGAFQNR